MLEKIIEVILPIVVSACELMGITVVAITACKAFYKYIRGLLKPSVKNNVKFELANGLATALEFKMAAEILKTVLVRTIDELVVLGAII
ncbi:MAG: DUF1622 domain-containing protein, partial [Oscillospiraceae bacterium]